MDTGAATTLLKMFESVPEPLQEIVLEHMRGYIEEVRDEAKWKALFTGTEDQLIAAARHARQEIAKGKSRPLDVEKL